MKRGSSCRSVPFCVIILVKKAAVLPRHRKRHVSPRADLEGGSAGIFVAENNDLGVDKKNDWCYNNLRTKEGEALKSKEDTKIMILKAA